MADGTHSLFNFNGVGINLNLHLTILKIVEHSFKKNNKAFGTGIYNTGLGQHCHFSGGTVERLNGFYKSIEQHFNKIFKVIF